MKPKSGELPVVGAAVVVGQELKSAEEHTVMTKSYSLVSSGLFVLSVQSLLLSRGWQYCPSGGRPWIHPQVSSVMLSHGP